MTARYNMHAVPLPEETKMTTVAPSRWFDLPTGARDWLRPGERHAFYLAPELSASDELAAWDQLQAWDALAGRMLRAVLFDDTEDARRLRKDAEAVAAVAEALAVRLGAGRA